MFDLTGKNALVIGGAGGLGMHMVRALLEAGAKTCVIDISDDMNSMVALLADEGFSIHAVQADISQRNEIRESYDCALNYLDGSLDILVNAAGIQRREESENFSEKDWDDVIGINLSATFFYCQLAAKTMIPQGGGKMINVASIMSICGGKTIPAYSASKGGVGQLTKTLSNDWGSKGININAIAPGYMDTPLNTTLMKDEKRCNEIMARIPQQRWGIGEDMKGITVFLASPASDYINGTIIPIDGGYLGR